MSPHTQSSPLSSQGMSPRPALDVELVADVERVLRSTILSMPAVAFLDRRSSDQLLARPLADLGTRARKRGVPIERHLVTIKHTWSTLSDVRAHLGEAHADVLATVIRVSIEEYFVESPRAD